MPTPPPLTRAHVRLLGLAQAAPTPPPDAESALSAVVVEPHARRALIRQLYLTGRAQWGVTFGERIGETLHVHHAAPHGPRWAEPPPQPYAYDTRYLLGYVDALVAEHGGRIDWQGVWRVAPDSRSPDLREVLAWVGAAAGQGLCDDRSPLLTAGWLEGSLSVRAYHLQDDEPLELPVLVLR
ncbi:hypothetical protein [Deinococcus aestuarii]|uniref:hypothetical protein n=1 Tax=Deinococcus aestuarii TaxID=2774531 RepID=UPI001C0BC7A5|nr:hypothetical protein [Deinococcus aestuarii]